MHPQVRELKCSRCGHRQIQRASDGGHFVKIEECPKCGTKGQMGTLRIFTYMPK